MSVDILQALKNIRKNEESYNKRQPHMMFYWRGEAYTMEEYFTAEKIATIQDMKNIHALMQRARKTVKENKK